MTEHSIEDIIETAIGKATETLVLAESILCDMTTEHHDFDTIYQVVKDARRYIHDQESTLMLYTDGRI